MLDPPHPLLLRLRLPLLQAEDPDLALAKMLQAQEQAWLAMAGATSGVIENLPPAGGGGEAGRGALVRSRRSNNWLG